MSAENLETERSLTAEIKLYYDLRLPENGAAQASPLLIAVHGYGGNKRAMMREAKAIAPPDFAIASLQGFHQHWRRSESTVNAPPKIGFAWLTNYKAEESVAAHHRVLRDLIENLIREGTADANRIYLLGFSQSCALNFRFAFANPDVLSGIIGVSGGIPSDWETNTVYQNINQPVFYLYGDDDEFYPLAKFNENAEKLKIHAANLRTQRYTAKHEFTDEMRRDIKEWLENESAK